MRFYGRGLCEGVGYVINAKSRNLFPEIFAKEPLERFMERNEFRRTKRSMQFEAAVNGPSL